MAAGSGTMPRSPRGRPPASHPDFAMPRRLPARFRPPIPFLALVALAASAPTAAAQATYSWTGNAGEIGPGLWLNPANWTGGPAGTRPGATAAGLASDGTAADVARFTTFPGGSSNGCGIDFGAAGGSLSWAQYQNEWLRELRLEDVVPATLKTVVFGYLIGITGCYFGMNAHGGTEGVGRAATRGVVGSTFLVLASNVMLVRLIQLIGW